MKINNVVKEAVAVKDIASLRNGLWACINIDPSFSWYYPDNLDYCLKNGITEDMLYEPHDGRVVELEITENNFALLMGQLRTNFSKERINKIKEMGKKLYPASQASSSTSNSENKSNSASSSFNRTGVKRNASSTKESASQMRSVITNSAIIVVIVIILAMILKK